MKETKLTSEQAEIVQNNNGLRMYLSGLSTGHSATPRSNLYNLEGKTELLEPDEILKRWMSQLERLESGSSPEHEVFQFDSHQLEKWGPQGEVKPIDDLLEDIVYPTFSKSTTPKAFSTWEWEKAKWRVRHQLWHAGAYALRPASYRSVVDDMRARDTLESNSGWPLFTRRHDPKVIRQSIKEAANGQWKTYPAIALFRNYNQKTRLVWMFPMSANLVEGSFFQPLQSRLMHSKLASNSLAPWTGFEQVRDIVGSAYSSDYCVAASDFSSTDAHFRLTTSNEVFDVIKDCFQREYWGALWESIWYMHNIPLIVGLDRQIVGEHGVSSGSNWTNFIETIFDLILGEYVSIKESELRFGTPETLEERDRISDDQHLLQGDEVYAALYAIGDDMSWFVKRDHYDADFQKRLDEYGESVGQVIKAEKTMNLEFRVKSLQRLFQQGYLRPDGKIRAVYSTVRALKSLVFPERFHSPKIWSKDMEAVRAFMILENCVDHPLFEQFCEFVASGDPNLKVVASKSRQEQNKLHRASKLVHGLTSTYNQEKRDARLSEFQSVKFIRNL